MRFTPTFFFLITFDSVRVSRGDLLGIYVQNPSHITCGIVLPSSVWQ